MATRLRPISLVLSWVRAIIGLVNAPPLLYFLGRFWRVTEHPAGVTPPISKLDLDRATERILSTMALDFTAVHAKFDSLKAAIAAHFTDIKADVQRVMDAITSGNDAEAQAQLDALMGRIDEAQALVAAGASEVDAAVDEKIGSD